MARAPSKIIAKTTESALFPTACCRMYFSWESSSSFRLFQLLFFFHPSLFLRFSDRFSSDCAHPTASPVSPLLYRLYPTYGIHDGVFFYSAVYLWQHIHKIEWNRLIYCRYVRYILNREGDGWEEWIGLRNTICHSWNVNTRSFIFFAEITIECPIKGLSCGSPQLSSISYYRPSRNHEISSNQIMWTSHA